jgi:hypothetical protein
MLMPSYANCPQGDPPEPPLIRISEERKSKRNRGSDRLKSLNEERMGAICMKTEMNTVVRVLMFMPILLAGCQASRNVASTSYQVTRGAAVGSYKVARAVAVGSYRVATAPVHYATRKRGDDSYTTASTESLPSDVTNPGQSVPPERGSTSQNQVPVGAGGGQSQRSSGTGGTSRNEVAESSGASRASAPSTSFPTGKLVPGKPGYVFSPSDKEGRYVDVSGFPSGTKVKDPWTNKIFIVP